MAPKREYDIPSSYHHTSKKAGSGRCHHWPPEKRVWHASSLHIPAIQHSTPAFFTRPQWRDTLLTSPFPTHPHSGVCVGVCIMYSVCVCVCMHACVCRYACALLGSQRKMAGWLIALTLCLFLWERVSHWIWSYAGSQQSHSFSCFHSSQS